MPILELRGPFPPPADFYTVLKKNPPWSAWARPVSGRGFSQDSAPFAFITAFIINYENKMIRK